jgi:hypothetical protein
MRYLAVAAMCGTLVLVACRDDSRPNPMEPAPDAGDAIHCIKPGFPIKLALEQIAGSRSIVALYPKSPPRPLALALARVAEIAALYTICKPVQARAKLVVHTNILLADFQAGNRLVGGSSSATKTRMTNHINTMWQGVFGTSGANVGTGLFTGGPISVTTGSGNGGVFIPDAGFPLPTFITVAQLPNQPNPFESSSSFAATLENPPVFPPFFEIVATNATNQHYLSGDLRATVAICADDAIEGFPTNPAIAHIAVPNQDNPGEEPGGFEILDETSPGAVEGFVCEVGGFGSLFDSGIKGFASAAPRYLRTAAASLLLPAEAKAAATAAVGKTGLGGLARSLSPFGVTERAEEFQLEFFEDAENEVSGDPTGRSFSILDEPTLQWDDGLTFPTVVLRDGEGNGIAGRDVSVELVHVGTGEGDEEGFFSDGSTLTVETEGDFTPTLAVGAAIFDDLTVDGVEFFGTFKLIFSAEGAEPLESGPFTVSDPGE